MVSAKTKYKIYHTEFIVSVKILNIVALFEKIEIIRNRIILYLLLAKTIFIKLLVEK